MPAPASQSRDRRFPLNVALIVNGAPAGEVALETTVNGDAWINVAQLQARLDKIVDPTVSQEIARRAGGRELAPIAELSSDKLRLTFDVGSLQLIAQLPVDARALNTVSIISSSPFNSRAVTPPSDLAAGVTFYLGQRFVSGRRFDLHREPFNTAAEGFINVGGRDGVYGTFLAGFEERGRLVRNRTTLFHDDVPNAIRYALGDIDPRPFGSFAPATSILGVGVERLYEEIQPYRNIRPSGRGALTLDRASRVDVVVNGATYRTLMLAPGRYNLRDFPFLDGLNDVRLVVQDDSGRNETLVVSFFSDTQLLEPGLSIFSANLGLPRSRYGRFVSSGYDDSSPVFNGYYQRGISDRLTVGGTLQFDRRNALAGAQVITGTPIGVFGLETMVDLGSGEGAEFAALGSYRLNAATSSGVPRTLAIDIQYLSPGFSPLSPRGFARNIYSLQVDARFTSPLARSVYGTASLGYSRSRTSDPDLTTVSLGVAKAFGRINLNANYVYRKGAGGTEHRGILSISVPLSLKQSARASYDTRNNRVRLDYDLQGLEELGSTRARVAVARSDIGKDANIEVEHFANRFRVAATHDYTEVNGHVEQLTDLTAAFGIGYADGHVALGRDAGRGFVIVAPHPTMGDAEVTVTSRNTLGPTARAGVLGPALAPLQRGYRPDSFEVQVEKLRPGYDIGPGRLDVLPGAASGYLWTIGSAASNVVMGRLVHPDGTPVEFLSGVLRPVKGNAAPVPFFTNKSGRLVAQRVAAGAYDLVPAGSAVASARVVVPGDSVGLVDIGKVTVK